ncbi:MAG: hypothetical protein GX620_12105 [Chloroflexi bacterium]|nr:hypothetical protein [Chloroflexota bacterium]
MSKPLCVTVVLACLVLIVPVHVVGQSSDVANAWIAGVNSVRLVEGLSPYRRSSLLMTAAQRHAEDVAGNELSSTTGSDGSTTAERILRAGYTAWPREDGGSYVSECVWVGTSDVNEALNPVVESASCRDVVLGVGYREIGVGIATDDAGRTYVVLTIGARPNVLPIFINDDAPTTMDPQIAIRLTNEEVRPEGQGASAMGQAIEVRISSNPDFDSEPWQAWEPLVPWTLPGTLGEHTIYVQFRDAAGRTTRATAMITLVDETTILTPVATLVDSETGIGVTPTDGVPATPAPSEEGVPVSTPSVDVVSPETPTPLVPVGASTPYPTWTPLPTPTAEEAAVEDDPPSTPIGSLLILQGAALIMGLYLILRRGVGSPPVTPSRSGRLE